MDGYPGFGLDDRIIRQVNHVTIEPLLHQSKSSILRRYTIFGCTFENLINSSTINTTIHISPTAIIARHNQQALDFLGSICPQATSSPTLLQRTELGLPKQNRALITSALESTLPLHRQTCAI